MQSKLGKMNRERTTLFPLALWLLCVFDLASRFCGLNRLLLVVRLRIVAWLSLQGLWDLHFLRCMYSVSLNLSPN